MPERPDRRGAFWLEVREPFLFLLIPFSYLPCSYFPALTSLALVPPWACLSAPGPPGSRAPSPDSPHSHSADTPAPLSPGTATAPQTKPANRWPPPHPSDSSPARPPAHRHHWPPGSTAAREYTPPPPTGLPAAVG